MALPQLRALALANLYSLLRTIPAHQRHHLWLAERTRMILARADALEVAL